jgi:hypothetical protein
MQREIDGLPEGERVAARSMLDLTSESADAMSATLTSDMQISRKREIELRAQLTGAKSAAASARAQSLELQEKAMQKSLARKRLEDHLKAFEVTKEKETQIDDVVVISPPLPLPFPAACHRLTLLRMRARFQRLRGAGAQMPLPFAHSPRYSRRPSKQPCGPCPKCTPDLGRQSRTLGPPQQPRDIPSRSTASASKPQGGRSQKRSARRPLQSKVRPAAM